MASHALINRFNQKYWIWRCSGRPSSMNWAYNVINQSWLTLIIWVMTQIQNLLIQNFSCCWFGLILIKHSLLFTVQSHNCFSFHLWPILCIFLPFDGYSMCVMTDVQIFLLKMSYLELFKRSDILFLLTFNHFLFCMKIIKGAANHNKA